MLEPKSCPERFPRTFSVNSIEQVLQGEQVIDLNVRVREQIKGNAEKHSVMSSDSPIIAGK